MKRGLLGERHHRPIREGLDKVNEMSEDKPGPKLSMTHHFQTIQTTVRFVERPSNRPSEVRARGTSANQVVRVASHALCVDLCEEGDVNGLLLSLRNSGLSHSRREYPILFLFL